jgi:hypothetical protein
MNADVAISRDAILQRVKEELESLPFVRAYWEGGAIGFGALDEWSDLDLYVVVGDDKVSEGFAAVEKALSSLSPIKQKYDIGKTQMEGVYQAFYKLRDASDYHLIDLAVLQASAPDKYLEPVIHGRAVFHIRKDDSIAMPKLDRGALSQRISARLDRLEARKEMFGTFIRKEMNRRNYIEAVDLYRVVLVDSLVELLRMRHFAPHYDFKMRYVHRELPPDVVGRLHDLCFVKDETDLEAKIVSASDWFDALLGEIRSVGVARLVDSVVDRVSDG